MLEEIEVWKHQKKRLEQKENRSDKDRQNNPGKQENRRSRHRSGGDEDGRAEISSRWISAE